MDVALYLLMFIVSLGVLLKGSDWFIDSAETIGLSLGISPFIIGVTIVAFGTSLPELATSVASVFEGLSEIVVNNVVGSNITNIGLVLGLVAVVGKQIKLDYNIWHIDMPFLWGSAFLLRLTLRDGVFGWYEALLFIIGIVIFLGYSFKSDKSDEADRPTSTARTYLMFLIGGVLVWLGADYTIKAITALSLLAGISPEVIALTVVALGTSLPEVVVSLAAIRKGQAGMAVGNVLGSNIFNTYVVMAIPSFFGALTIPAATISTSLPIMLILTILFGVVSNNKKITRWEGLMLLMFYGYFILDSLKGVMF